MHISQKVSRNMTEGGWIRRMFDEGIALKQKIGEKNVFDLSLGNPVAEPPEEVRRALIECATDARHGLHRYMPNAGYPETRAAVASCLRSDTGLPFSGEEVVMTCAAAGAINIALKAILDAGDEVVVFSPFFPEYPYHIDNHQGVMKVVATDERFIPIPGELEKALNPRTRAVIVNSPNNPTGAVYDENTLSGIGDALRKARSRFGRDIFLIADDVYRKLVYDRPEPPYVFKYHEATILATSHSKDIALPGERIGYAAVNPAYEHRKELVDGMVFCNRVLGFVNAPALMQRVVQRTMGASVDMSVYKRKRDLLYDGLTGAGYSLVKPEGAFYMFPRSPVPDDVALVGQLRKHNVLVVPGVGFGAPGYFRISYCVDDWVIEGALKGFRSVARECGLRTG